MKEFVPASSLWVTQFAGLLGDEIQHRNSSADTSDANAKLVTVRDPFCLDLLSTTCTVYRFGIGGDLYHRQISCMRQHGSSSHSHSGPTQSEYEASYTSQFQKYVPYSGNRCDSVPICFTICLFISPDLDGHRAPKMKY